MKKAGTLLLLLACLFLFAGGCSAEKRAYRQAQRYFAAQQYAQAAQAFESLGDYKDAADRALECKYLLAKAYMRTSGPDVIDAAELFSQLGDYADAPQLLHSLQDAYYYAECDQRIPSLETVFPDALRREENGKDENGAFRRYTYSWSDADTNALSTRFMTWISSLEKASGVGAEQALNGAYFVVVDGERVGLAETSVRGTAVQICVTLYTNPIS